MTLSKLEQKHLKERITFERSKQKALKHLQEGHDAILSIFEKKEDIPQATLHRLQEEKENLLLEWSEEGEHFKKMMKKQKQERTNLLGSGK